MRFQELYRTTLLIHSLNLFTYVELELDLEIASTFYNVKVLGTKMLVASSAMAVSSGSNSHCKLHLLSLIALVFSTERLFIDDITNYSIYLFRYTLLNMRRITNN
jgi:hypothetical protein